MMGNIPPSAIPMITFVYIVVPLLECIVILCLDYQEWFVVVEPNFGTSVSLVDPEFLKQNCLNLIKRFDSLQLLVAFVYLQSFLVTSHYIWCPLSNFI